MVIITSKSKLAKSFTVFSKVMSDRVNEVACVELDVHEDVEHLNAPRHSVDQKVCSI